MGAITSIAIQAAIILALEYLIYKWALSSSTFFRVNRAIIMASYLLAVITTPLMSLYSKWFSSLFNNGVIFIGDLTITMAPGASESSSFNPVNLIPIIYLSGVVISGVIMMVSYIRLFKVIGRGKKIEKDGFIVVVSDREIAPYSWGKYIVLSEEDVDNHLIMLHENAHIRFHHSYELLISNLFVVFNWFNPAAYLMRRELCAVQEYEADEQVIQSNVSARDYQMLLIKKTAGSRFQAITNSLNHSQLKNRLTMMMKTKSKPVRLLRAALLLPALLGAAAITSTPAIASVINSVESFSLSKGNHSEANDQQTPLKVIQVEPISGSETSNSSEICDQPEVLPQFKDGEVDLYRTLAFNMKYPRDASDAGQQGKVVVKFNVYPDGTASDFVIEKSCGYESLDQEALRVCKEHLSTGWIPGQNNGETVICTYSLPVMFRLS